MHSYTSSPVAIVGDQNVRFVKEAIRGDEFVDFGSKVLTFLARHETTDHYCYRPFTRLSIDVEDHPSCFAYFMLVD